ncbi:pyridoxal phosphate-dependent aminotransferase, partial [Elusimicrobiota bacterium]
TDSSYATSISHIGGNIPIAILRTFSKIYGLAGLRIGYCLSEPGIIALLNKARPPFNTNRLAQIAASAAIDDRAYIEQIRGINAEERARLYKELDRLHVDYYKSQTNFVLIRPDGYDVNEICEYFMKSGIIIRPLAGYSLECYLRVTLGKHEDNTKFIELLELYLCSRRKKH